MSISELVLAIGRTIDDINSSRKDQGLKIALDSLGLVKRRVINKGLDSDGQKFGKYSEAVVPYYYYYGKETNRNNQTAVAELLGAVGFWASYKDWRKVNNLPVDHINFSFTNRMWNSLTPVINKDEDGRTVVTIVAKTDNESDKLKFQNARFGDILEPSKSERDLVTKLNKARILDSFKKNGLADDI